MIPRTRFGRVLLTGGDHEPCPRDACRTSADVDATVALYVPLTTAEQHDVAELKAELGRAEVRR